MFAADDSFNDSFGCSGPGTKAPEGALRKTEQHDYPPDARPSDNLMFTVGDRIVRGGASNRAISRLDATPTNLFRCLPRENILHPRKIYIKSGGEFSICFLVSLLFQREKSELPSQSATKLSRFYWMEMYVVNTRVRLSGKSGWVKIVDIVITGVKKIETIEGEGEIFLDMVADSRVEQSGAIRFYGIVLYEWPRTKIAQTYSSKESVFKIRANARGQHVGDRSRNLGSRSVIASKSGTRDGIVSIESKP